jgi:hypothetical protein
MLQATKSLLFREQARAMQNVHPKEKKKKVAEKA